MQTINPVVKFFINLGKTHSILTNRFDRGLGGLGFNEFLILYYISHAEEQKISRIELAKKIGMTASGVTRLLLPMEKIHLVKSGPVEDDARVRFVMLSAVGKEKLGEALERLDVFAEDFVSAHETKEIERLSTILLEIGGKALMV
ncbi:MAG: winged helix-turn-helix transcriptional regulator [Candidatus Magasanikbacteria bacterium]|nr:winged helix-turn-helix transcriptional regulator [Candidatus Magasanikbacteria bacterium]